TELIAGEHEALQPFVPERQRERTAERLHGLEPAFLVEMRHQLGIVVPAERVAAAEAGLELASVVERAREDGAHRSLLVSTDGDGRPGVGEDERRAGRIRTRPGDRERRKIATAGE